MLTYDINSDIDVGKNLMMGMYNNRSIFFDPLAFNYEVRSFPKAEVPQVEGDIVRRVDEIPTEDEYLEKTQNAAEEPVGKLIPDEFRQSPTRFMSFITDNGVMPSGVDSQEQLSTHGVSEKAKDNFDVKETMSQSIMRYSQLFTVKTEITIPGDFTIKAGDVIQCDFPDLSGSEVKGVNSETKGIYMVASVCHRITPTSSNTSLSLVRDSFGGK